MNLILGFSPDGLAYSQCVYRGTWETTKPSEMTALRRRRPISVLCCEQ